VIVAAIIPAIHSGFTVPPLPLLARRTHRQPRNLRTRLPSSHADIVRALQIEPKLGAGAKPMSQA
jgi:hypothetical protein